MTLKPPKQTKGWMKDKAMTVETVTEFFGETGTVSFVKICRAGGKKISKW